MAENSNPNRLRNYGALFLSMSVLGYLASHSLSGTSVIGSGLPQKPALARYQISTLENIAAKIDITKINNWRIAREAELHGSMWVYNENGDLLDPWHKPYSIKKNGGRIVIISIGLEEYNSSPWYRQIFDK